MTLFHQVRQILTKGFKSAIVNENGLRRSLVLFIIFYVVVPLGILAAGIYLKMDNYDNIINPILGIVTVFVAFVFQIVFNSNDKFASKYESYQVKKENNTLTEHYINYLKRLKNLTTQFIQILSFLILLSLFIMVVSLLYKLLPQGEPTIIVSSIVVTCFYFWVVYLVNAVVDMYQLLMDDLNKKKLNDANS